MLSGLNPGSLYDFQVRAKNSSVTSPWSAFATVNAPADCAPVVPPTPTGLTATPVLCGTNQLSLDWNDATGATSYSVYYSNGTFVGNSVGSNYTFTGPGPGQNFTFYVRANNSAGVQSGNSATATGITPNSCSAPTAAPQACGTGQVSLSWGNVTGATGYDIQYRLSPSGAWTQITNATSPRMLSGLNPGSLYDFQVRAKNSSVTSPWSAFATVNAPADCALPPPPPVITADLRINGSDGPISVISTDTLNFNWSSAGASSCTLYGAGFSSSPVPLVGTATRLASVVTSSPETYVLNCNGVLDSVVVNVTPAVTNRPPNAPTITGPSTGDTSVSYPFTFTATDPDGDQIQYDVDWNNDDTTEVTSLLVNSGVSIVGNRSWPTVGTYTLQVRARDSLGAVSAWTEHTISIVVGAPSSVTLEASINGGGWSGSNQTVNSTDSVALRWNSTNATSCSGNGAGFNTSGNRNGSDNVNTPAPNSSETFTVSCDGAGGNSNDSLTITTRQLPNLTVSPNGSPQFSNFDPVTKTYGQVTVLFRTQNNGGGDTTRPVDYRFELDINNDGSYEVNTLRNDGVGALAATAGENETETVNQPIPFGTHGIRITVDVADEVDETNEGDNVYIGTITNTPPDPNLSITANPTRVQNNQTSTITWTVGNPYSLNCSVFGPAMTTRNFNPITNGATGSTSAGPITAKSEYTLRCVEPVSGAVFTDTATVETQGVIEEI
jgi:hypothetical protein